VACASRSAAPRWKSPRQRARCRSGRRSCWALPPGGEALGWAGLARNLVPVVAGNLVGGSVLVALV
jgi:hypothetical protein